MNEIVGFHYLFNDSETRKRCNYFIGKVKSGIPDFTPPPFTQRVGNETYTFADMCYHYGFGILVVPFVAVLTNVAIAKAFGE